MAWCRNFCCFVSFSYFLLYNKNKVFTKMIIRVKFVHVLVHTYHDRKHDYWTFGKANDSLFDHFMVKYIRLLYFNRSNQQNPFKRIIFEFSLAKNSEGHQKSCNIVGKKFYKQSTSWSCHHTDHKTRHSRICCVDLLCSFSDQNPKPSTSITQHELACHVALRIVLYPQQCDCYMVWQFQLPILILAVLQIVSDISRLP